MRKRQSRDTMVNLTVSATCRTVCYRRDVDARTGEGTCERLRGGKRRSGKSPQQPDGIFNIHSWNVRNAGQSELTEEEKAERTGGPGGTRTQNKSKTCGERVAQRRSEKRLVSVNKKIQNQCRANGTPWNK